MDAYNFSKPVKLFFVNKPDQACYQYALEEIERLLGKAGIATSRSMIPAVDDFFILAAGEAVSNAAALPDKLKWDGYVLNTTLSGVTICARSAKGILNGVYGLVEQSGVTFVLPGEEGEWFPARLSPLETGTKIMNPRFPYRGVFWQPLKTEDFPVDQWLEFYAKLRFNSIRYSDGHHAEQIEKLGLRNEIGGHGLSTLLPRDLFDEQPGLFRMFQPEDFGGKRMKDSNFCVTNPETREIVKTNFKKILEQNEGVHAIHAWADDLPAGGWCLCPSCRAFSPRDQAMLAMRLLAEAVRECESETRIPFLAYHDTMFPGRQFAAPAESFLLFAPRERCYAHALDDPDCRLNQYYLKSLQEWTIKFASIDDAHTFEYYFDQILFRGMYPFLPEVIAGDMAVYQRAGIESHMSLQVGGPEIAPEYNMLIFAALHWNEQLSAADFCRNVTVGITGEAQNPLRDYLTKRAEIFAQAMRFCEHDPEIYMDYRWLPETLSEFGREMADKYLQASKALSNAATELEQHASQSASTRLRDFIYNEVKRARFEAAELMVMHYQQLAMNAIAEDFSQDSASSPDGCKFLEKAIDALDIAREKAHDYKLPDGSWYFRNINNWLRREFTAKIEERGGEAGL